MTGSHKPRDRYGGLNAAKHDPSYFLESATPVELLNAIHGCVVGIVTITEDRDILVMARRIDEIVEALRRRIK